MRSRNRWLFVLAMLITAPACLTEPQPAPAEPNDPALSIDQQSLEEALRCPGDLVDCCGDGTCILPLVCKSTQCATAAPPLEASFSCGDLLVDCCGDGTCIAPEVCRFTHCASETRDPS